MSCTAQAPSEAVRMSDYERGIDMALLDALKQLRQVVLHRYLRHAEGYAFGSPLGGGRCDPSGLEGGTGLGLIRLWLADSGGYCRLVPKELFETVRRSSSSISRLSSLEYTIQPRPPKLHYLSAAKRSYGEGFQSSRRRGRAALTIHRGRTSSLVSRPVGAACYASQI